MRTGFAGPRTHRNRSQIRLRESRFDMTKRTWSLELIGIPLIVLAGSLLHFTFQWSGNWPPVALFAAVNESVWEHLKLAFWPALAWAVIEYAALRPRPLPFWAAKGFALLAAPLLIVLMFYGYTSLLGRNILLLDIATFVVAIAAGQIVSARLTTAQGWTNITLTLGTACLACQLLAYSTFTYYPPPLQIFEDGRNGSRGIPLVQAHQDRSVTGRHDRRRPTARIERQHQ
jgi:hypothetical protein